MRSCPGLCPRRNLRGCSRLTLVTLRFRYCAAVVFGKRKAGGGRAKRRCQTRCGKGRPTAGRSGNETSVVRPSKASSMIRREPSARAAGRAAAESFYNCPARGGPPRSSRSQILSALRRESGRRSAGNRPWETTTAGRPSPSPARRAAISKTSGARPTHAPQPMHARGPHHSDFPRG